jgi:lipoate-protein ligase A
MSGARASLILWCDGAHPAIENMRRDAALLDAAGHDGSAAGGAPVLRLFQFCPHGITLGHSQAPERELDLERCRADGIIWAIRPTGGRAIFHAEEWTYSLAAPLGDPDWGGSLTEAYAKASRLILASLKRLGVPAVLASSSTGGSRRSVPNAPSVAACFASAARHEILLEGRKLVGSAQRRTAGALLQQGSILIGPGHLRLAEYLRIPSSRRAEAREALRAAAADAGSYLGAEPALECWAEALLGELPGDVRRVDGAAGRFLLTLPERGPYTPAVLQ